MDGLAMYYQHVIDCITRIDREERDNVDKAAHLMAGQIKAGQVIHCYGVPEHNQKFVAEFGSQMEHY